MKTWLIGKYADAGKDRRWEKKGSVENEIVGWHQWLNGHESVQALGAGDGQGSLVCCSSWSCKELDMTEQLNWTELNWKKGLKFLLLMKDEAFINSANWGMYIFLFWLQFLQVLVEHVFIGRIFLLSFQHLLKSLQEDIETKIAWQENNSPREFSPLN